MTVTERPIAHARAEMRGTTRLLIIDSCPICGGRHQHGGGDFPGDGDGHRTAHCPSAVECRDCGTKHLGGIEKGTRGAPKCTPERRARFERLRPLGYVVQEVEA